MILHLFLAERFHTLIGQVLHLLVLIPFSVVASRTKNCWPPFISETNFPQVGRQPFPGPLKKSESALIYFFLDNEVYLSHTYISETTQVTLHKTNKICLKVVYCPWSS